MLWSVVALVFLVAADPPDPSVTSTGTEPPKQPPVIGAWLQRTRGVAGPMAVIIAPRITMYGELSPHSYTIEKDGSLTVNNPVADAVTMDFAHANNILYIPTVSTGWENGSRLLNILNDPKLRADHVKAISDVARSPYVDGIDLDYENLPAEARQGYTQFVIELAAALHNQGKLLSVTVPPKIRSDDPSYRYTDYAPIGQVADRFRVMAYEYHGKSGGPGAIAPAWWMRAVMSYTVSVVPREKVSLGIHLYGYDWGAKNDTPALWWTEVKALQAQYGGVSRLVASDAKGNNGESVMTYTIVKTPYCPADFADCAPPIKEKHTVWYVDAGYVAASLKIVQDLGLGGLILWRPGGEDPAMWDVLSPTPTPTPAAAPAGN